MKSGLVLLLLFLAVAVAFGQADQSTPAFADYQEMRAYFGELYQEQKYVEAAAILEEAIGQYPDHLMANSFNLAIVYGHLNRCEEGIEVLRKALAQGVFFNKWAFDNELWNPCKELESFQAVLDGNEKARQEAQKKAKPDLLVVPPAGYDKDRRYPLFIALHGGGGSIAGFKDRWTSDKLKNEYIVAFVQSSQVVSMTGFNWTEDIEISKREIDAAYHKVVAEYTVDSEHVIVGGFSSGGVAALEVAFSNTVPVIGFIALCPARPEGVTAETISKAKKAGLRGTVLTTEMDPRLDAQKEMIELFKTEGFVHRFVITPDIGHWFPEDLNMQIDESIEHINSKP